MFLPRIAFMSAMLAAVAFAGLPHAAAAQDAAATAASASTSSTSTASRPDFSGTWAPAAWSTDEWPLEPPYNAAGRDAQEEWATHREDDPSYRCIIPLGRIISAPLPFEIIQQEERAALLYEYDHQVRRVFLDGRGHPDSYPTLMGHSIGRFDGDTLVIETANIEPGLLRPQGMPYSGDMRLTERMTLLDEDRLQVDILIEDPTYYREAWGVTKYYDRTDEEIKDYECFIREHLQPAE